MAVPLGCLPAIRSTSPPPRFHGQSWMIQNSAKTGHPTLTKPPKHLPIAFPTLNSFGSWAAINGTHCHNGKILNASRVMSSSPSSPAVSLQNRVMAIHFTPSRASIQHLPQKSVKPFLLKNRHHGFQTMSCDTSPPTGSTYFSPPVS